MSYAFGTNLLEWFESNQRDLPWNKTKDPYKIWISEIMLQQTRVDQALPYYQKFIKRFPDVFTLAKSDEAIVLKHWEGLGYYSRARHIHYSAKHINDNLNGVFPTDYETILSLKGVGRYTAAAISSFAFGLAYPAIDGNVYRVVSRYFALSDKDLKYATFLKNVDRKVDEIFVPKHPADFNRAIMNLGALVCTPKNPQCADCPLSSNCHAYMQNEQLKYPPKKPKVKVENRFFHYLFLTDSESNTIVEQRAHKDIWSGLYQFPLVETKAPNVLDKSEIDSKLLEIFSKSVDYTLVDQSKLKQKLTHRMIYAHFYHIQLENIASNSVISPYMMIDKEQIKDHAFPKIIVNFLNTLAIIVK